MTRLSRRSLFAGLAGALATPGPVCRADDKWKLIATVRGNDEVTQIHILNLLDREKIPCAMDGSLGVAVRVEESNVARALKILQADADKQKYSISFSDGRRVAPGNRGMRTYDVKKGFREALQIRSCTLPAELISVLEDRQVQNLAKSHPIVARFHARRRSYLLRDGGMGTAYEGDVELSDPKRKALYVHRFQVWDLGKRVSSSGGGGT